MSVSKFPAFAKMVAGSFQKLVKGTNVFVADLDGDNLYETYLAAFPEGTNPIFKKQTEHDCSCCKHFVRRAGTVITIDGTAVHTIWDEAAKDAPDHYREVAVTLRTAVLVAGVRDLYRVGMNETGFGAARTQSMDQETKQVVTHEHFYTGEIPRDLRVASPGEVCGGYRTTVQVFERGLTELTSEAVETVLALIQGNSLYRGEEHKRAVVEFQKMQKEFLAKVPSARTLFVWKHANSPAARFRNTVIGTLVQDLSDGFDVADAVAAFEKKVAPENYKRTTAVVTPGMVKKAMETIELLGLEPALERRFAKISDISVNDVKWVSGRAKPLMKGGIGGLLEKHLVETSRPGKSEDERAEEISLDEFMTSVLPETTELEVFFKNRHIGNLMSLTAPVHPEPRQLFRWDNDFAWSYGGNVADSYLRQQVQSLGGRVDGVLRFSHMWNHIGRNASLMDLHVFLPGSSAHKDGQHDNYPSGPRVGWNRRNDSASGGVQDVDYVHPAPEGHVPVENTTFPTFSRLKDGPYTFAIHNWAFRVPTTSGFRAEIEFGGQVFQYEHPEPLKHKEWITLAVATLKNGVFTIDHKHPTSDASKTEWGLKTERYAPVSAVTLSPNFWGENHVGNKHVFFFLEGAMNDQPTRGFYNEFLNARLEPHRKVFEIIADKTKCQPTEGQLSGLGFSSTKKDSFLVRVRQGKRQRIFNVTVGT